MRFRKIKRYFAMRRSAVLFALTVIVINMVLGLLCAYPIDLILYAPCLSLAILIVIFIIDYNKVDKKLDLMEHLAERSTLDLGLLPPPANPEEELMRLYVEKLQNRLKAAQHESVLKQEEKSTVLTCWIHQIKTPVAALKLLAENSECGEKESFLIECTKIEHYLDMILQMIRLDEYENDLVFSRVDVQKLVRQVIRKYAKSFIYKNNRVVVDVQEISVLSDEKYLQFVIEQICANSLKYTQDGEIRITMDERCILVIEDTGIGISEQDLPRVFEKGFTGYNGRFDKKATGIGLYLVKQVLDRLGNKITIESSIHQGTKISIDLYHKETCKD